MRKKEGREREEGYGIALEVEEKRRNGEMKKGEWEKCGWERGKAGGGKLERVREKEKERRRAGGGR